MTSHTKPWKQKEMQEIKSHLKQYKVIAIADLERFPTSLFQDLRKKLMGKAVVKVSKQRIIKKALQDEKIDSKLVDSCKGKSIAVIFSSMNPFELFAFLKKNKGNMPAKAGMVAPLDIIVPKGDTGLPPGPALSDLKQAGLNPRIQGSTIAIAEDTVVAKAGAVVTAAVAGALAKLDIKPIKVGLNIIAAFEEGQTYVASVLDISTEEVLEKFMLAQRNSFNLAVEISYICDETIELLLQKSFREAKAVALEAKFLTKETAADLLARANAEAQALKALVKGEIPAEPQGKSA